MNFTKTLAIALTTLSTVYATEQALPTPLQNTEENKKDVELMERNELMEQKIRDFLNWEVFMLMDKKDNQTLCHRTFQYLSISSGI